MYGHEALADFGPGSMDWEDWRVNFLVVLVLVLWEYIWTSLRPSSRV